MGPHNVQRSVCSLLHLPSVINAFRLMPLRLMQAVGQRRATNSISTGIPLGAYKTGQGHKEGESGAFRKAQQLALEKGNFLTTTFWQQLLNSGDKCCITNSGW